MKLQKIGKLCKANKRAIILERVTGQDFDGEDMVQQYISDGYGIYPIYGMPELGKESLLTLFDIPKEKWNEWYVSKYDAEEGLVADVAEEEEIEWQFNPVVIHDVTYRVMGTADGGILFIDQNYLSPLEEFKEFRLRKDRGGVQYVAVKAGLLMQALIRPTYFPERFLEEAEEFGRRCRREMERRERRTDCDAGGRADGGHRPLRLVTEGNTCGAMTR